MGTWMSYKRIVCFSEDHTAPLFVGDEGTFYLIKLRAITFGQHISINKVVVEGNSKLTPTDKLICGDFFC
jgi:hypothetical protein